jgi:type IV pilus assembly protein PilM
MRLPDAISSLLADPPPAFAFELSESGIASASSAAFPQIAFHPLPPETISVSPVRDNVLVPDRIADAVRAAAPPGLKPKRREAVLILPDNSVRVSVIDFDTFPGDPKEQAALVRFRLKKSVPYDVEQAALSYFPQPGSGKRCDVVAAVAPLEIIARYEAPFRAAGLEPGVITTSALAMLRLVHTRKLAVAAKLSGRVLTLLVVDAGTLKLVRCLELAHRDLDEVAADLFPTFVFIEDQFGRKAEELLLAGFGDLAEPARRDFSAELGVPVAAVQSRFGVPGEFNAGLTGYVQGVMEKQ